MGIDYNVYLGPYIEYRVRKIVTMRSLCPRPEACPSPTTPYCQECGLETPVGSCSETCEEPEIETYDLFEDVLSEAISTESEDQAHITRRLIPNVEREGWPRDFSFNPRRYEGAVDLEPSVVSTETAWLAASFAPEIEKLVEAGALDVSVRWGLLYWQS